MLSYPIMKTKIIYFTFSFLAIIGLLVLIMRYQPGGPTDTKEESQLEKIALNPEVPEMSLPLSNNPKDAAWNLFQKYLEYNKTRNLAGIKSVVYKIAPVCEDPKTRIDCEARMGAAYSYGNAFKKSDFVHFWSDEKQAILATDFWIENNKDMNLIGRFRSIIFFLKDEAGNLKMLSFSPTQGGATGRGEASEEELTARVTRWSEDTDQDGIADYNEECLGAKEGEVCNKTNPKMRDTDGDGLWDGVQALIQKLN